MTKTKAKEAVIPSEDEYKNLVDLLAIFSETSHRLAELDSLLQQQWMGVVDEHRKEYTTLQTKQAEAEAAIELMVAKHPEWFVAIRSVKTPYGDVSVRSSTKLEVKNEELTLALIEQREDADLYTRTRKFLNLEALEDLEDAELNTLKIKRVTSDKTTVKPMKADLGKAVKLAEKGAK